jgi:hypothetical protein
LWSARRNVASPVAGIEKSGAFLPCIGGLLFWGSVQPLEIENVSPEHQSRSNLRS